MAYALNDFEKDVLEASNATPVVVDFWAEWCGPCQQLGPTIEKLAGEAKGRWKLVKVDTDKNPDLARQFGVRGIPAVKMVYQQEIIAEFTGAQPEHMIRKWLAENLPENGSGEADEVLGRARQLLGEGDREGAKSVLKQQIGDDSSPEVLVRYAMLLLPDQIEQSRKWLERANEQNAKYDIEVQTLQTVESLRDILEEERQLQGDQEKALQLYHQGIGALFGKDFDTALSKFIECLQLDRSLDDDGVRKACIACFAMLGEQHPLAVKYRRRFSMSLY